MRVYYGALWSTVWKSSLLNFFFFLSHLTHHLFTSGTSLLCFPWKLKISISLGFRKICLHPYDIIVLLHSPLKYLLCVDEGLWWITPDACHHLYFCTTKDQSDNFKIAFSLVFTMEKMNYCYTNSKQGWFFLWLYRSSRGLKRKKNHNSVNLESNFFSSCLNKLIPVQSAQLGRGADCRKHLG